MKIKLFTLALSLPIYACQADPCDLDQMRRENEQLCDRSMNQHYQSWDQIKQNLEQEEQKIVNKYVIENQNKRLFGK